MKLRFLNWILVFLVLISSVSAVTLSVYPSEYNVREEESVDFYVKINTVMNIYAVQFELNFDKDKVKVLSVSEEGFLGKDGTGTYPITSYNNVQGNVKFASTRYGVQTSVNGDGDLAKIRFRGLDREDNNVLELNNVIVLDADLNKLSVNVENGIVNVLRKSSSDDSDDSDDSSDSSNSESTFSTIDYSDTVENENKEVKTLTLPKKESKSLSWKIILFIGLSVIIGLLIIVSLIKKLLY